MLTSSTLATINSALEYNRFSLVALDDLLEPHEKQLQVDAIDAALAELRAQAAGEVNKDGLLPCPFCGYKDNEVTGEPGMYEILCEHCDRLSFAYFHTKQWAIEAWNKRAPLHHHSNSPQSNDCDPSERSL